MSANTSRRTSSSALSRRSTRHWGSWPGRPRPSCSSTVPQGVNGSAIRSRPARSSQSSLRWAFPRPRLRVPTRAERSGGLGARKETGTIASSSSRSVPPRDGHAELLRRFVEAARRAQIVTIVNSAATEAELGELFTAELCEAFEAEIAFVLTEPHGGEARKLVGAYGLTADERVDLLADERCAHALTSEETHLYQ